MSLSQQRSVVMASAETGPTQSKRRRARSISTPSGLPTSLFNRLHAQVRSRASVRVTRVAGASLGLLAICRSSKRCSKDDDGARDRLTHALDSKSNAVRFQARFQSRQATWLDHRSVGHGRRIAGSFRHFWARSA